MASNQTNSGDVTKVQIYADADHIDDFTVFFKRLGMSQREAGSRLFEWFNRQSPLIRQHILQPMPEEVAPDIARIILERMAEQDRFIKPNSNATQNQTTPTRVPTPAQSSAKSLTVYGPNTARGKK